MCSFRLHKNTCHYDSKRFCHFCTKRIREKKKPNKNTVCHPHSIDIFNSRVNNFAYGRSVDSRKCSNVRQVDQCLSESLMIAKYFGCICTHNVNVFVWFDMSQHCNHNYRCFSHSVRRSNCSHSYIIFFVFFITFWLSEVLPLVVRYSHPSISFPIFSRFLFLLMSIISISRFTIAIANIRWPLPVFDVVHFRDFQRYIVSHDVYQHCFFFFIASIYLYYIRVTSTYSPIDSHSHFSCRRIFLFHLLRVHENT